MSQTIPDQRATSNAIHFSDIRTVKVRPFDLLRRSYEFIRGQYWLFFGLTSVGLLVSSAVPFGILLGPMFVGIYRCLIARERSETVDFTTLFQGFDSFKESLIATLVMMAITLVLIVPLMLVIVIALAFLIDQHQNGANGVHPVAWFTLLFAFFVALLVTNMLVFLPFLFAFQLIADRNVSGSDAMKFSFQAVRVNLVGLSGYLILISVVSISLMMMCYIPLLFILPVLFTSFFLVYRDVFPRQLQQ